MSGQRTLLPPQSGQGIVPPEQPTKEYQRYPLVMIHPGYQPGVPDKEIKVIDEATGKWTGNLKYEGHQAIRFPPVHVKDKQQEEYHASQGYVASHTCDPAAFARFVQTSAPVAAEHKPIEYPKWVGGKIVQNADEEAELLRQRTSEVTAPQTNDPPTEQSESRDERIARLKRELAELEPVGLPTTAVTRDELAERYPDPAEVKRRQRSQAIKDGLARRKAKQAKALAT